MNQSRAQELVDSLVSNSEYNNIGVNELIITFVTINSQLPTQLREKLFSKFAYIWKSEQRRETLISLCRLGAATPKTLMEETGLTEASISRALSYLKKDGFVVPAQKIRVAFSKGGPRPIVWAIKGCHADQIREASEKHARSVSPLFSEADRISQLILDEYMVLKPEWMRDQIKYDEILQVVRKNTSNYQVLDLAQAVATQLNEKFDINVWRKV